MLIWLNKIALRTLEIAASMSKLKACEMSRKIRQLTDFQEIISGQFNGQLSLLKKKFIDVVGFIFL